MQALPFILSGAGQLIGGIGSMVQRRQQAEVLEEDAKIAGKNVKLAVHTGEVRAQDTDAEARSELGTYLAERGASGLSVGSSSFMQRLNALAAGAARDRGYATYEASVEAANHRREQKNLKAEAGQQRTAGFFDLLGGTIGAGASLITGYNKQQNYNTLQAKGIY